MADHNPVTSSIAAPNGSAVVHFHCPCGTNRRQVIVCGPDEVHPIARFTSAIRRLHTAGRWPTPDTDLGDAAHDGWGTERDAEPAA